MQASHAALEHARTLLALRAWSAVFHAYVLALCVQHIFRIPCGYGLQGQQNCGGTWSEPLALTCPQPWHLTTPHLWKWLPCLPLACLRRGSRVWDMQMWLKTFLRLCHLLRILLAHKASRVGIARNRFTGHNVNCCKAMSPACAHFTTMHTSVPAQMPSSLWHTGDPPTATRALPR